jgi:hypothetical protein
MNFNYLTNSTEFVKRFAGDVTDALKAGINRTPWGQYASSFGTQYEEPGAQYVGTAARKTAEAAADVLTDKTRRKVWAYTNPWRMAGMAGQAIGPKLGVGPTAGAVAAFGIPAMIHTLSGTSGPITEGLRPAGYKAVYPVSKEEDPTGRTVKSAPVEFGMRYVLGQRSQLLPYQEFKKERPDVAPSTFSQYRRYQTMKPEAGELIKVDPEGQSFSVLGGVIRGSARGLNDPEIRIKGVPITASAALGTAAGAATVRGLADAIKPTKIDPKITQAAQDLMFKKRDLENELKRTTSSEMKVEILKELGNTAKEYAETLKGIPTPNIAQKAGQALGDFKDPVLLAAGAAAALGTAAVTKKLMQKAQERRIKKEDPVEYLKYKHGDFTTAAQALGQPQARSWQNLSQYVQ